ncbi:hypothetical protein M7775_18145 [Sporomusa sphaeroides DSM 2875]|uniref:hypothetical protein n=1 Tax=Sporomusa sphaeroides TaxID=47679 RepID=UPI00202E6DC0|nr:hypothetical protein [Sporomusa sphaeroides]MCM0760478.1 hypothetical protein [Sporomusa sphaeroides DSM 2875]
MDDSITVRIDFSKQDCVLMYSTVLQFQEDIPDFEPKIPYKIVRNIKSAAKKLKRSKFEDDEELDLTLEEFCAIYDALLYAHDEFEDTDLSEFGIEVFNCSPPDFLGLADRIKNFVTQCGVRFV